MRAGRTVAGARLELLRVGGRRAALVALAARGAAGAGLRERPPPGEEHRRDHGRRPASREIYSTREPLVLDYGKRKSCTLKFY